MANVTLNNITPPRVPLIDSRTGLISREWYRFFLNLFTLTGGGENTTSLTDLQVGPPSPSTEDITDVVIDVESLKTQPSQESVVEQIAELEKQVQALIVTPPLSLGTLAQLQQENVPWLTFDNTPQSVPSNIPGTLYWDEADGNQTLSLVMAGGDVTQQIGEEQYYRIKADSTITEGQVIMFTGTVGASGGLKGAPATGLTAGTALYVMGVATENIATNNWGYVTSFGLVRGINTTGGAEAWVDGQILYLDPAVPGGLTKTLPAAPNPKVVVAAVVHAATNGSLFIRSSFGGKLGDFEGDVQITSVTNDDLLQYYSAGGYWRNIAASSVVVGRAANLSGGATGSLPYQSAINTTAMLAVGSAGQVLKVNSGATAPEWATGAALTKTDDTNVTLTLGGAPSTSLLAATSITLGWTGQLSVARGGSGAATFTSNGVLYGNGTSAFGVTVAGTTGQVLIGNTGGAPSWSALSSNAVTSISFGATGLTPATATQGAVTVAGTLATANGGTGLTTFTANGLVYASSTSALATSINLTWNGTHFINAVGNLIGTTMLVARGGGAGAEGGQLVLGYGNNAASGVVSQDNNTWNMDVDGSNTLRLFRQGSTGTVVNVWSVAESTGVVTFNNSTVFSSLTASKPVFTDANKNLVSTGTLATDQGGTGLTGFTANGLVYASSTSALATSSNLTWSSSGLTATTSAGTATLKAVDTGGNGANLALFGNGATTPNKYIRAQNGNLQVINSAYSAVLLNIADSGLTTFVAPAGFGYGGGAGGAVTQATNKSTAVTLNKPCCVVTMNNAALAAGASVLFRLNNNILGYTDNICVNALANGNYRVEVAATSLGWVDIRVTNVTGGSLSDALEIQFSVIKSSNT